jgi:hypothetical protein
MLIRSCLFTMALAALAAAPAHAQAPDGLFAIGYGGRGTTQGLEVSLGIRRNFGAFGLELLPLSGIVYSRTTNRYRDEVQANGNTACRDTRSGQLVTTDKCGPRVAYAAIVSGDVTVVEGVSLGLGARLARRSDAFLMLRIQVGATGGVHLKAGGDYVSLGASTGF